MRVVADAAPDQRRIAKASPSAFMRRPLCSGRARWSPSVRLLLWITAQESIPFLSPTPMTQDVFITGLGKFFPGAPIPNDQLEDYLGRIHGRPARAKARVLAQNGI